DPAADCVLPSVSSLAVGYHGPLERCLRLRNVFPNVTRLRLTGPRSGVVGLPATLALCYLAVWPGLQHAGLRIWSLHDVRGFANAAGLSPQSLMRHFREIGQRLPLELERTLNDSWAAALPSPLPPGLQTLSISWLAEWGNTPANSGQPWRRLALA